MPEVLEAIVARIPPPKGDPDAPLKALVFDSFYDSYQGVVVYVRLTDGRVRPGTRVLLMSNGRSYDVQQVGVFSPDMRPVEELSAGQVGYLTASIKRVADAKVGETITETARPTAAAFPATATPSPWSSRGSTRSRTRTTRRSATPSRSSGSTTRPSPTSPRPRSRWATAFAAGSSACCTWRSSRSGSSASSTSR